MEGVCSSEFANGLGQSQDGQKRQVPCLILRVQGWTAPYGDTAEFLSSNCLVLDFASKGSIFIKSPTQLHL